MELVMCQTVHFIEIHELKLFARYFRIIGRHPSALMEPLLEPENNRRQTDMAN